MKQAIDDLKGIIVFVVLSLIYIFILATLGSSFGGQAEQVANQAINGITILVVSFLALPPIGLFIWIISLAFKASNEIPFY